MRMNNFNVETRFSDDNFKEKEIERFEQIYTGSIILKPHYNSEEELNKDWQEFKDMSYEKRYLSNSKALKLYGKKNEEIYREFKHKFLKTDIKNSKILDKVYAPEGINYIDNTIYSSYSYTESNIIKDYRGYVIAENYEPSNLNYAISLIEAIEDSTDNIEKIFLYNELNSIDEDSIVINSLKKYGYKKLEESIDIIDEEMQYPLGMNTDSFFTINEIMNNNAINLSNKDKVWVTGFLARSYGLKSNIFPSSDMRPGWNPLLTYTDENRRQAALRVNHIYSNDLFRDAHFIDISTFKGNDYDSLEESDNQYNNTQKGITIYFIHGELDDGDNDTPRVVLSLDNTSDEVIPLLNGELSKPIELNNILSKYEWANVVVFFLPLEDGLYDKIYNNIMYLLDKQEKPKENFLRDISDDMKCPNAIVANDKVFYMFLINAILELGKLEQRDISSSSIDNKLFWNKKPNYSYILYKGNKDDFKREDLLSKLDFYKHPKLSVEPNQINEGYFRMKKTNLTILNESNDISNDIDYLSRVPFKEVSELLNKNSID